MEVAIVAALILAPIILHFFLSSSGSLSFLVLSAAILMHNSLTGTALPDWLEQTIGSIVSNPGAGVLLISVPYIATVLLTAARAKHSAKLLHIIPAVAAAGVYALTITPLLTQNAIPNLIVDNFIWDLLQEYGVILILTGVLSSMFLAWFGTPKPHHEKHK